MFDPKTRRIIYLIETKLTNNDLKKYGSNYFIKKDTPILFYNVSPITRSNYFYGYHNKLLPNIENQKIFFNIKKNLTWT